MDLQRFACVVLDEAKRCADWHRANGMKPTYTPSMPMSVALSILREARHSGIDVDAFLEQSAAGERT